MSYKPISDYGLIDDLHSAALVVTDGSIDWCCLPRFDGAALFSRLLDDAKGGYFQIALLDVRQTSRHYLPAINVLETTFTTGSGTAVLTDFMPSTTTPPAPTSRWKLPKFNASFAYCTAPTEASSSTLNASPSSITGP